MHYVKSLLGILLLSGATAVVAADRYKIDSSHSTVGFSVSHMVLSKTRGTFGDYTGDISWDSNPAKTSISGVVRVNSIDTRNADRDAHLRSPDFFDVATYPEIRFVSKTIKKGKKASAPYEVEGVLTLKGVSKPVKFPLLVSKPIKDPWGNTRVHFNAKFTINRRDFGMNFSKVMDNGGLVVGNDVEIELDVEGIQDKSVSQR